MRAGQLIFGAIQFMMILALLCVGAGFFGLHFLSGIRLEFSNWILQSSDRFLILGYLLSGTAVVLGGCFWSMQRTNYLRIKMDGKRSFEIDSTLVQKRLETEFSPKPVEVYFSHQKIEVITEGKVEDLEQVEERLAALLSQEFGYEKEFFLTLKNPE